MKNLIKAKPGLLRNPVSLSYAFKTWSRISRNLGIASCTKLFNDSVGIENKPLDMVELKHKTPTIKASNLPKQPGLISMNKIFACPIIAIVKQTIPDINNKLFTILFFKHSNKLVTL